MMPYTAKQRRFFHAAAERGESGMKSLAAEADKLTKQGKERPPVKRRMSEGGIANDYGGEFGERSYRDGMGSEDEIFDKGGMVECPKCGHEFGMDDDDDSDGFGQKIDVHGDVDGEEGSEQYSSHGKYDSREPQESFGRALMKKYGRRGI